MEQPAPTPEGIAELLARARQGDRRAEQTLFEALDARIQALAKRRVWDEDAARDVAQETMLTILRKYRDADLPRGLLPWAFTVLHNMVGNYLKRHRRDQERLRALSTLLPWELADPATNGYDRRFELISMLRRGLSRATPECRRVFRLLLSGARREEIRAAFENAPMGTIDSRISRCRKRLLDSLAEQGDQGDRP